MTDLHPHIEQADRYAISYAAEADYPNDYVTRYFASVDGIVGRSSGVFCVNDMFDVRHDITGCGEWTYTVNASPIDEEAWVKTGIVIDADGFIYDSV